MNRRTFLKFLGIGTATAVAAPQILAVVKPKSIEATLRNIQTGIDTHIKATMQTTFTGAGRYMYVRVAPNTMPFRMGDLVRYKANRREEMIAYRTNHWNNTRDGMGVAISTVTPGNCTFIKISGPDLRVMRLKDGSLKAL